MFGNKIMYRKTFKMSLLITSLGSITSPFIKREHWILDKPSLNTSLELSWDNSFNSGSFSSFSNISWGGDFTFGLQKIARTFNPMIGMDQNSKKKKLYWMTVKMNFWCSRILHSPQQWSNSMPNTISLPPSILLTLHLTN